MDREKKLRTLGEHIRSIRLDKNMSQDDVGDILGKDRQAISRIELGLVNPTYLTLIEISESLNITLAELINSLPDKLDS